MSKVFYAKTPLLELSGIFCYYLVVHAEQLIFFLALIRCYCFLLIYFYGCLMKAVPKW